LIVLNPDSLSENHKVEEMANGEVGLRSQYRNTRRIKYSERKAYSMRGCIDAVTQLMLGDQAKYSEGHR
jgi:hypothetical protein